jgi:hypothetical protein
MEFEGVEINGIIVFFLILITAVAMCLTIYLGNRFPNRRWLGILLSIIFAPWGQAYIEGSPRYIIALVMIAMFSKAALGNYFLPLICSPLMMWYRFNKLYKIRATEQKEE